MRHSEPPDELNPESGTVSRHILTPRGGFMARPGLKPPPTHAVVVRGGDAPLTEEIPVARSSFLPPPPPSDPALSEKDTLRAIPRRSTPPADLMPPSVPARAEVTPMPPMLPPPMVPLDSLRPVIESLPPPSDAPVATSVDEALPRLPLKNRSRWAIVAAAIVGLLLGMISVATTVHVTEPGAPVAAAPLPPPVVVEQPKARPAPVVAPVKEPAQVKPAVSVVAPAREPARAPQPAPKHSIF